MESGWVEAIQRNLLAWYDQNKRDLPWRINQDPYRIWVSEIMLQQTRVDTVIPYYERFMERFPTLGDLAGADEDEVVKAWEGLGYYSRARHLHAAVREVTASYDGEVPQQWEEISRLKGVGAYTAGAILSIAYDQRVPAVDGNVMRVFSRWLALWDDVAKVSTRKRIETLAIQVIPADRPGDFNQALMELGALICSPLAPRCDHCPVRDECHARQRGIQAELPVKSKAKPPVPVAVTFGWITDGSRILLEKRPPEGLLAGMWGLPTVENNPNEKTLGETLQQALEKEGFPVELGASLGELEHVFSHRRWRVTIVEGDAESGMEMLSDRYQWVQPGKWDRLAFPNVYHKAIRLVSEKREGIGGIQGRLF
nr:A/G-specific adenine glycosylase [Desmospora profundinema]